VHRFYGPTLSVDNTTPRPLSLALHLKAGPYSSAEAQVWLPDYRS